MKTDDWLQQASQLLANHDIQTARLDILVLMEDALRINRAQLLAHPETDIPEPLQNVLDAQVARRAQHEPLAYIRGKSEFYGRDFVVSPATLVPRPESEMIIDLLKDYVQRGSLLALTQPASQAASASEGADILESQNVTSDSVQTVTDRSSVKLADVGSGSGALGITAALELPDLSVDLLEIDPDAINTSKDNVINFATGIRVIQSDLLGNSPQGYDILLCNLPYVPDTHNINRAAAHEPALALFGGADGLDLYRELFKQVVRQQPQPLLILCESFPSQHEELDHIASDAGYRLDRNEDFIQAFVLN